ncbi:MAG: hypothetical protein ABSF33_16655, partial [Acidimicrobiales bacterium]
SGLGRFGLGLGGSGLGGSGLGGFGRPIGSRRGELQGWGRGSGTGSGRGRASGDAARYGAILGRVDRGRDHGVARSRHPGLGSPPPGHRHGPALFG